jgi:signal-transduction protein with cAMP-binding, CBS, and nucleotidyltransferase domain
MVLTGALNISHGRKNMLVSEILKSKGSDVFTSGIDTVIKDLTNALHERRIGASVVVDSWGKVVGIIAERDIVYGIARYGDTALEMGVDQLMSSPVSSCNLDNDLSDVMAMMTYRHVRHVVVLDEGRLAGIVSIGDVVKHRLDDMQLEVNVLRDYVRIGRA